LSIKCLVKETQSQVQSCSTTPLPPHSHLEGSDSCADIRKHLLVILLLVLANNVVEPELVNTLAGGDDPQPVPELLLLEELLSQVLEVATAELLVRDDLDLSVLEVRDADRLAEVSGAAVDLYARLQECREGGWVEDLVVGGLAGVDDVLLGDLASLLACRSALRASSAGWCLL